MIPATVPATCFFVVGSAAFATVMLKDEIRRARDTAIAWIASRYIVVERERVVIEKQLLSSSEVYAALKNDARAIADHIKAMGPIRVHEPTKLLIGGCTTDEVVEALGKSQKTVSARIRDLKQCGVIRETEHRRATRAGRMAVVHEFVEIAS